MACRSIEAEIIRRCIHEKSPTEYRLRRRLVRTSTDQGEEHGSSARAVAPHGGARRVACATPGKRDTSPRAGTEEGQSPDSGARAAEESDARSSEDAAPVLKREARKAVRSAPPPVVPAACMDEENNPSPAAALAPRSIFGSSAGTSEGSEETRACGALGVLHPLQGQLYLHGEELIVPDPALALLHCLCERTVAVCHPAEIDGAPAFVDVCIDCGNVSSVYL